MLPHCLLRCRGGGTGCGAAVLAARLALLSLACVADGGTFAQPSVLLAVIVRACRRSRQSYHLRWNLSATLIVQGHRGRPSWKLLEDNRGRTTVPGVRRGAADTYVARLRWVQFSRADGRCHSCSFFSNGFRSFRRFSIRFDYSIGSWSVCVCVCGCSGVGVCACVPRAVSPRLLTLHWAGGFGPGRRLPRVTLCVVLR